MKREQSHLSSIAAASAVTTLVLPTAVMTLPSGMIADAGQDAWLSAILSTAYGAAVAALTVALARRFPPHNTLIDMAQQVRGRSGRWVGGFFYFFFCLQNTAQIVREVPDSST